jgi:predicted Zn-dependent peptidase
MTARIMVRATPEEADEIRSLAAAAGVTVPEFLRRSGLSRKLDMQARSTAESLRQLSRIGNNLNQIAHLAHLGEYNQQSAQVVLDDVRRVAAALVGKGGVS